MDTIESLQALDGMVREAVVDLLYRLADDELIMGHRDSQWTWPASVPAEDLPFASMARDEIGHAHAYYQMLHELGEPDPNTLMLRRRARQFRCVSLVSSPKGDWGLELMRRAVRRRASAARPAGRETAGRREGSSGAWAKLGASVGNGQRREPPDPARRPGDRLPGRVGVIRTDRGR